MLVPSRYTRVRDQGLYFDGLTARPHKVTVNVFDDGLQIRGEKGEALGTWSFHGLRIETSLDSATDANLMHGDHPDARLVLTDPALIERLGYTAPDIFKKRRRRRGISHILLQIGLIFAIIATVIFVIVPRTAGVIAGFIPVGWETEWGESAAKQVVGSRKICRNMAGRRALDQLVSKLAESAPAAARRYHFNVTVIKTETQNALATMGGQIVVFSKLIDEMDSADELAGVLAHEIAHVTARHPLIAVIEAMATTIFAGMFGSSASDLGGALTVSAYSRNKEAEADRIAGEILRRAEIGSQGLAKFFERLKRAGNGGDGSALALFATHPEPGSRASKLKDKNGYATSPALSPAQWRALKKICS